MLHDLKHLADRYEMDPDELRKAARTLLAKQFLFLSRKQDADAYRIVLNHFNYFHNLFDALGWTLERDEDFDFIGIVPTDTESFVRLKLVDTLLVLCLRLLYEEGMERFDVFEGSVYVDAESLLNRYTVQTKRALPGRTEFNEILKRLRRFGIVEMGEVDPSSGSPRLRILPSIRKVTDGNALDRLTAYLPEEENADSIDDSEADAA